MRIYIGIMDRPRDYGKGTVYGKILFSIVSKKHRDIYVAHVYDKDIAISKVVNRAIKEISKKYGENWHTINKLPKTYSKYLGLYTGLRDIVCINYLNEK